MIVLDLKLDGIYGFNDFDINLTYPKKVVHSIIDNEYLEGRERFRYKKVILLMGANATGKTSLGKVLLKIATFMNTGNTNGLLEMVNDENGFFSIDFINEGYTLHRICADITYQNIRLKYYSSNIEKMDSYEMCVEKLVDRTEEMIKNGNLLKKLIGHINYRFAYPEIDSSLSYQGIDKNIFKKTLHAIIGTLDPTLKDVSVSKDLKNTFIIRRGKEEIIIQEGKLLNRQALSSGTTEGIDVAIFLASMMTIDKTFYYCDEHFSYIQSDIEKRIFGLMLERIKNNEQLIFTTHNTDMLDLNLPKHTFMFLKKYQENGEYKIHAMSASDILKRNTDSVRCAVENDVFGSIPDDSLLDELEIGDYDE